MKAGKNAEDKAKEMMTRTTTTVDVYKEKLKKNSLVYTAQTIRFEYVCKNRSWPEN